MKKISFCAVAAISLLMSCSPEEDPFVPVDYNRLTYLIQDNFNLATFSAGLLRSGHDRTLLEDGPYTVLVPSDEAFASNGIGVTDMQTARAAWVNNTVGYHILEGLYELEKLPFVFNQELRSIVGNPVYVTRWIKEQDTVATVNGVNIYSERIQTNNGIAYVLENTLTTDVHENIVDYIAAMEDLTLFSQAIQRSGLVEILRKDGPYTIFAPNNDAMIDFGYASLQAVNAAEPSELAELVRYHVLEGRRFYNDFPLTMTMDEQGDFLVDDLVSGIVTTSIVRNGYRGSLNARMMDGNRVTFVYAHGTASNAGRFRLTVTDVAGEEAAVHRLNKDFIGRNGVVHHVNKVMKHAR